MFRRDFEREVSLLDFPGFGQFFFHKSISYIQVVWVVVFCVDWGVFCINWFWFVLFFQTDESKPKRCMLVMDLWFFLIHELLLHRSFIYPIHSIYMYINIEVCYISIEGNTFRKNFCPSFLITLVQLLSRVLVPCQLSHILLRLCSKRLSCVPWGWRS